MGRGRRVRPRRLVHRDQAALGRRPRARQCGAHRGRRAAANWLTWKLLGTGRLEDLVTDRSDASGTGYFDPVSGEYRRDILAAALRIDEAAARQVGAAARRRARRVIGKCAGRATGAAGRGHGRQRRLGARHGSDGGRRGPSPSAPPASCAGSPTRPAATPPALVSGFADATGRSLPLVCTLNGARVLDATARLLGVTTPCSPTWRSLPIRVRRASSSCLHGGRADAEPAGRHRLDPWRHPDEQARENLARAAVEGIVCSLVDALECLIDAGGQARVGVADRRHRIAGGAGRGRSSVPVPVAMPAAGEYVALGAARQAAWAASGEKEAPVWALPVEELPVAEHATEVVAAYRAVRPWS